MTISPELLQRLMQINPQAAQAFINEGGQQYTPLWEIQGNGYDGPVDFNRTGYAVGAPYQEGGGGSYGIYDLAGANTGKTAEWQKDTGNLDALAMLAMAGATGGMMAFGPNGLLASGAGAAPGAVAAEGVNPWAMGFTDTGTAMGAADAAYAGSGALTGAGGMAAPAGLGAAATTAAGAGGSSLLSQAAKAASAVPSWLGPAATALGGVLGAQGQKETSTQTQDIPAALKPYVYGQGGLLSGAQSLFQQQTAPGYMAGYDQMRNTGMGLLNGSMKFGRGG